MYYNQFTKRYHLSEKTIKDLDFSLREDVYDTIKSLKSLKIYEFKELNESMDVFLKFINLSSKKDKNNLISFDRDFYDSLIRSITEITDLYISFWIKKEDHKYGIEKEILINFKENEDVLVLVRSVDMILSTFNTSLSIGVYPRYLKDFIDLK